MSDTHTYEEHIKHLASAMAAAAVASDKRHRHRSSRVMAFRDRLIKDGKGIKGFRRSVDAIFDDELSVSPVMADYLMARRRPARLVHYLASHPDETEAISAMKPAKALRTLASLRVAARDLA